MSTQVNETQNNEDNISKKRKIIVNRPKVNKLSNLEVKLYQMYIQSERFEPNEYEPHLKTIETLIAEKLLIIDDNEIENYNTCTVDFTLFVTVEKARSILLIFQQRAKLGLACLKYQIHKFYAEMYQTENELNVADIEELKPIDVRLVKHKPFCSFSEIKSSFIHRLVTIKGTVIRASSIKPLVIQMAFDCTKCKGTQVIHFLDGKYNYPTKCATKGCGAKSFEPNRTSYQTITVDSQSLKIQENTNDNSNDLGRVPRTVDCEVSNSLVDRVTPGDMVVCTGLVKANQASGGKFAQKSANTIYTVYLDLVNISKASGSKEGDEDSGNRDADQNSKESIKFSDKDLKFVNALYSEPNLFKLIVNSFCPKIFGHELVKAGVLLSLFGGRRRNTLKKGDISIRGDSHVLIVGDPGLGKSQILMAAKNLAPRGVYVCGTSGVSSSGLTVTLSKEAGSNDFALEAGALVLGDQGTCCIDEFDKMTHEHSSLLEAMEQQSISIAKGGIVCTLPARTSIVAAANPTGGHYNKAKTVSENLKMNSALLSRFDLVFILLDKPNQVRDHYLSKHIMQIHSGRTFDQSDPNRINNEEVPEFESSNSDLYLRLHRKPGEKMDLVPGQMLRKYIAYAKAHCQPYLSPKAGIVLKEFYLELRKKHQSIDSTPITTRQLESLIRLAEARAKMELRETVTEADAQDVVELLKHSLFDTYEDEVGNLDFSRSQNGTGMSKRETVKRFLHKLNDLADEYQNKIFSLEKLKKIAEDLNLKFPTGFRDFVEGLNNQGYLLKKGAKSYELSFGSVE